MKLETIGIGMTFESSGRSVTVLDDVSFAMTSGEALAIMGPSGSGKSTLLHIVGTLEPPTAGTVRIDGANPYDLDEKATARFRNSEIGFVFQDHHLLPQYSVLENALLPTVAFGDNPAGATRARTLLERVGLGHRLDHRPAELSGGERQRVAIARALVNDPSVVLCDEPTGNLDTTTAETVADLLIELHGENDNVLIVVTHSLELAQRFARRLELRDGRCFEG